MAIPRPIRLPRQWPNHVKSGILHAISLASVVLSYARGRATDRRGLRAQLGIASRSPRCRRRSLPIPIPDSASTITRDSCIPRGCTTRRTRVHPEF